MDIISAMKNVSKSATTSHQLHDYLMKKKIKVVLAER
jgi:hypothetical protein